MSKGNHSTSNLWNIIEIQRAATKKGKYENYRLLFL